MSKMSQLHAELSEQASELGFETIQDAVDSGYDVDYSNGKLVKRGLGYSETVEYLTKEREKAHEAWEKEKEKVLASLSLLRDRLSNEVSHYNIMGKDDWEIVEDTINFIEKGEV